MTLGINVTIRNNMLSQINTAAGNSCIIALFSGTQPATGGSATGNTILVELTGNASGFAATPASGSMTLNAVTSGTATATGTATWGRIVTTGSNPQTPTGFVFDFTVGTAGTDLVMNSTSISTGATVSLSSGTITAGNP